MSDFINTVDIVDDDVLIDSIITKSISGSFNDDKITQIKPNAFAYCTNLESVCFPKVTNIGGGAFTGSGLKAITPETFPNVTKFPYQYGPRTFSESALETVEWPSLTTLEEDKLFPDCTSLKSISLPNLSEIKGYGGLSLSGCTSLTDVNLPLITKSVGFSDCTSLETITLPLLQSVGGYCFNNCTSLRVIDLPSCTSMTYHSNFINCPFEALILRSATVCDLSNLYSTDSNNAFYSFKNSGLTSGIGYVYVPRDLIDSYKAAIVWNYYPSQFRALEDYTVDGTTTGAMREHCESLGLNATELIFTDANSQTLIATGIFGILDGQMVWSTSDKTVVGVNRNGMVTPTGEGTATITVICGTHSVTCAVTVSAGIDFESANILYATDFNTGYIQEDGNITSDSTGDTHTDKFDISEYAGSNILITLLNVKSTPAYSRIVYYDSGDVFINFKNGVAAGNNVTITSTVPVNAVRAAISINKSNGFSGIDITHDDEQIGYIDYIS